MTSSNQNIQFFFNEDDENVELNNSENHTTVDALMMEFEQLNDMYANDDDNTELMNFYNDNYNVKDLLKICEYYGIIKDVQKCKKLALIYNILLFENNLANYDIVLKRKQMWHYINELKQDKFMKRYILW